MLAEEGTEGQGITTVHARHALPAYAQAQVPAACAASTWAGLPAHLGTSSPKHVVHKSCPYRPWPTHMYTSRLRSPYVSTEAGTCAPGTCDRCTTAYTVPHPARTHAGTHACAATAPAACAPGIWRRPASAPWAPHLRRCARSGRGTAPRPGQRCCPGRRTRHRCPARGCNEARKWVKFRI